MSNIRRTLAIKIQTPGGDNPLQMVLVGKGPFYRGIAVSGLALVGKGGTAPYAFSIIAGGDSNGGVNGLTLHTDGTFTGTGNDSGRFVFVAEVADSAGAVFPHSFSITFLPQLFIVRGMPRPGEINLAYSYQFVVEDATATVLTSGYSLTAGNLPAGLSLTAAGLLHGTPTAPAGISYFTLTATDGVDSIQIPCVMTVYEEVTLTFLEDRDPPQGWGGGANSWLPSIIRGVPYMAHAVITGGVGPYSVVALAIPNPLPTGIKYDNGTRRVIGTTLDAATPFPYLIEFKITDGLGHSPPVTQRVLLIIDAQQGRITPQLNGTNVGGGDGATKYNFIEGANVTLGMSNDGDTFNVEISAGVTPGHSGIDTINGVGPDSNGALAIDGIGVDSNGDLFVIPSGTTGGVTSVNGATGVVTETSNDGSLGHTDTAGSGGNIDWTARLLAKLVTVAALPANTYANGTAGVGATLTGNATGTLTVDGVLVALNDFVLVTQEASGLKCGLYKCTTAGAVGVAYVLTRATRMDSAGKYVGAAVTSIAGSTLATTLYECTNATAPTVGTTAITFTAIASPVTPITRGGTGQTTATAAFNALAPASPAKGDLLVFNGTNWVKHTHGSDGSFPVFNASASDGITNAFSAFVSVTTIAAEILADSPTLYYPLTEAAGATVFANLGSASGCDITIQNGAQPGISRLFPLSDTKYARFFSTGTACSASVNPTGVSVPNGDHSMECVVCCGGIPAATSTQGLFVLNNNASNTIYAGPYISGSGTTFTTFYAANSIAAGSAGFLTHVTHYAIVNDATAKNLTFYINGHMLGIVPYTTAYATTQTAPRIWLGADQSGDRFGGVMGECAFYYGQKLSEARIVARAKALGLYGT